MIHKLIAEATECDFKLVVENDKPLSWLKSVSAFANGIGGTLLFGVDNNGKPVGLADAQADGENISRRIKDRMSPVPDFILTPLYRGRKNYTRFGHKARERNPLLLRNGWKQKGFCAHG